MGLRDRDLRSARGRHLDRRSPAPRTPVARSHPGASASRSPCCARCSSVGVRQRAVLEPDPGQRRHLAVGRLALGVSVRRGAEAAGRREPGARGRRRIGTELAARGRDRDDVRHRPRHPDGARTHTVEIARGFARAGLRLVLIARGPDPGWRTSSSRRAGGTETQRARRGASIACGRSVRCGGSAEGLRALLRAPQVDDDAGDAWSRERSATASSPRSTTCPTDAATRARSAAGFNDVKVGDDDADGPLVAWRRRRHGRDERSARRAGSGFRVGRIGVIPIGVDVDYFPSARAWRRAGPRRPRPTCRYALFIGQFASWVDFATLLDGFAPVARERPDAAAAAGRRRRAADRGRGPDPGARDRGSRQADRLHHMSATESGICSARRRSRSPPTAVSTSTGSG